VTATDAGLGPSARESASARSRVLCVDDDAAIGHLLRRVFGEMFEVVIVDSAAAALVAVTTESPFAAVISDYRMPGTDGVTLLGQLREIAPDMVRLLLTGNGDMDVAVAAVNEGQIFRFLSKPCTPDVLRSAVDAAVQHYRLVTAERVLLEQTLHGSIKALTEVLALAQPEAFGRATRVRRSVAQLADAMRERDRWPIEIAAMLSQVGWTAFPASTVERFFAGESLTPAESRMIADLPATAERLIAEIPRLERVRDILAHQEARYDGVFDDRGTQALVMGDQIPVGARMLKIALDFDLLELRGLSVSDALTTMQSRTGWYDPRLLDVFTSLHGAPRSETAMENMRLSQVRVGMVFAADVRAENGMLLVARGQEVGVSLVDRIRHQWQAFAGRCDVSMLVHLAS
jgi:response regulator RpfG family c-di-GMP phosphodiesterase